MEGHYDSDPNSAKSEDPEGYLAEAKAKPENPYAATAKTTAKPAVGRLTDDRIRRLEELGFVWSLRDDWMKHYEELRVYRSQFGNCNVPARYTQNRRLGIWVSAQRQLYKSLKTPGLDSKKQRPSSLTAERIDLLNNLGFTWTIRSRDNLGESWNQRLADLIEYKKRHGDCLVPSRYPENPELGVWVGTQRTNYRLYLKAKESGEQSSGASAMNEERIQQLEELGFVWSLRGQDTTRKEPPYGIFERLNMPAHLVQLSAEEAEARDLVRQVMEM